MTDSARPVLTVIAGPNGVGKSTFTSALQANLQVPVVDPDAIARGLHLSTPEQVVIEAGREAIKRRIRYLNGGISFAVETTLAGNGMLRYMEQARRRGFTVHLVFIGVDRE